MTELNVRVVKKSKTVSWSVRYILKKALALIIKGVDSRFDNVHKISKISSTGLKMKTGDWKPTKFSVSLIPKDSYRYISYFCKLLLKLLKDEWNQWTERKTLYRMDPSKLVLKILGFII